eukprot:g28292.t1
MLIRDGFRCPVIPPSRRQAYKAVLDAFLQDGKYTGLRLVPVPLAAKFGLASKRALMPQPLWSAVALALAQLNAKQQTRLKDLKVELLCAEGAAEDALRDTLSSKVAMATSPFAIDRERGRIPQRKEGYSWCRRDNDQDARLWRLEAFILTQRAVYAQKFMVETKDHASSPQEESTLQDLSAGETVMEVAAHLVSSGFKVVAVNAASAYQVGGGSTTGGRHALEEACVDRALQFG